MRYFIGIDGGGTKTKCILADEELKVLYECSGGPSNFLITGADKAAEIIFNLVAESMTRQRINIDDIKAIVVGAAGAGRKKDAVSFRDQIISNFRRNKITAPDISVESDARIALEGAFSGRPGAVLNSGTGSIIIGKDSKGNIFRAGGYGRIIGDEGSGYKTGLKGLSAVSKSFDGRGEPTLLADSLKKHFNITSGDELIKAVYNDYFDIASAAPFVIEAAEKNDEVCRKIIHEETDELIAHIKAMQKMIEPAIKIALSGSILQNENYFRKILLEKIKSYIIEVVIARSENSPAAGALIMARSKVFD